MPALDFPSSPTNGQIYEQYTYDSTKGAWRVIANPGATVVSSPTAPASPVSGNLWLNTNDGVLFVYYDDGDTSQWVEVKSNTASGSKVAARVDALELSDATINRSGLVPVLPGTVAVGSGSASVDSLGVVSFSTTTSASAVSLNNVFSSQYRNYQIVFQPITNSAQTNFYLRLRAAGTDNTSSNYRYAGVASAWTGSQASWNSTGTTVFDLGAKPTRTNDYMGTTNIELMSPFITNVTSANWRGITDNGSVIYGLHVAGYHTASTSFDGFTIYPGNGTFTGTIQVYGYR